MARCRCASPTSPSSTSSSGRWGRRRWRASSASRGQSAHSAPGGQPLTSELSLEGTHNLPGTRPLKVRELLAGKGTGLFHLVTTAPQIDSRRGWQRTQRVTGQITDLAVHTKLGATSGIVWVTRVSDGKVVPGAALSLYDADGAVKWQGKTDGDGLARGPGTVLAPGPAQGRPPPARPGRRSRASRSSRPRSTETPGSPWPTGPAASHPGRSASRVPGTASDRSRWALPPPSGASTARVTPSSSRGCSASGAWAW